MLEIIHSVSGVFVSFSLRFTQLSLALLVSGALVYFFAKILGKRLPNRGKLFKILRYLGVALFTSGYVFTLIYNSNVSRQGLNTAVILTSFVLTFCAVTAALSFYRPLLKKFQLAGVITTVLFFLSIPVFWKIIIFLTKAFWEWQT